MAPSLQRHRSSAASHNTVRNVSQRQQNVSSDRKGRSGRPKTINTTELVAQVRALPLSARKTLRSLANAVGIPLSTLLNELSRGIVKGVNIHVKPRLTEEHKRDRLKFALSFIYQGMSLILLTI